MGTNSDSSMLSHASLSSDVSLTVIVPTFEEPILLARALTSLRDQTHDSLQVLVVNNGGNPEVVDQVVAVVTASSSPLASRVVVHHRSGHDVRGLVLQESMSLVATPFVAILDASQTWLPTCADVAVKCLEDSADASAVCVGWSVTQEKMIEERVWPRRNDAIMLSSGDVSLAALLSGVDIPEHAMVYRRAAITQVGGVDQTLQHLAMWDVNVHLAAHSSISVAPHALVALHVLEQTIDEEDERRLAVEAERQLLVSSWMTETLPGGANKGQCALEALANRNRENELQALRDENANLRRDIANFNGLSSRALRAMMQPKKLVRAVQRRVKK